MITDNACIPDKSMTVQRQISSINYARYAKTVQVHYLSARFFLNEIMVIIRCFA